MCEGTCSCLFQFYYLGSKDCGATHLRHLSPQRRLPPGKAPLPTLQKRSCFLHKCGYAKGEVIYTKQVGPPEAKYFCMSQNFHLCCFPKYSIPSICFFSLPSSTINLCTQLISMLCLVWQPCSKYLICNIICFSTSHCLTEHNDLHV